MEKLSCPNCQHWPGVFAKYCSNCGQKIPVYDLLPQDEGERTFYEESIEQLFGYKCSFLHHAFVREIVGPYCPECGKDVRKDARKDLDQEE